MHVSYIDLFCWGLHQAVSHLLPLLSEKHFCLETILLRKSFTFLNVSFLENLPSTILFFTACWGKHHQPPPAVVCVILLGALQAGRVLSKIGQLTTWSESCLANCYLKCTDLEPFSVHWPRALCWASVNSMAFILTIIPLQIFRKSSRTILTS